MGAISFGSLSRWDPEKRRRSPSNSQSVVVSVHLERGAIVYRVGRVDKKTRTLHLGPSKPLRAGNVPRSRSTTPISRCAATRAVRSPSSPSPASSMPTPAPSASARTRVMTPGLRRAWRFATTGTPWRSTSRKARTLSIAMWGRSTAATSTGAAATVQTTARNREPGSPATWPARSTAPKRLRPTSTTT